jgi:AcrR family transcriptional regulator
MPANSDKTRERILSVAERLFARHGFNGVSMRDLAGAAKVPLALVSYHFGPKKSLYRAVFARRYTEVTDVRSARLARIDGRHAGSDVIEQIVEAFLDPILELRSSRSGANFARLLARETVDPDESQRGIIAEYLDPTARMFLAALQRALPTALKSDVALGYQFLIGALVLILADSGRLARISDGAASGDDIASARDALVHYAAAGLSAIVSDRGRRRLPGSPSRQALHRRSATA